VIQEPRYAVAGRCATEQGASSPKASDHDDAPDLKGILDRPDKQAPV
jgi:hypothetical protein